MKIHDVRPARRALGIACAATAAMALSACGSDQADQPANGPVATKDLAGVGTVLVDTSGKTLYFTDSEATGTFKCAADCLDLWRPAAAPGESVSGAPVADVGVVKRPDGSNQLAYQNKPLYTFTMDSPDKPASGHNASDSFGGQDFTWHAVVVSGSGQAPPPGNDGGYGGGGGY